MIPRILKSKTFWIGVAAGTVAGPIVLARFAPGVKDKLPGQ